MYGSHFALSGINRVLPQTRQTHGPNGPAQPNPGQNTLYLASAGIPEKRDWIMKDDRLSPRYTIRWDELMSVF
ncbi:DUF4113 domain-containing protein [Hydrogenovibrio sp.]|uniref:DUF4113 domain-containing protein n=1 Tax=Hydrogenovibrio sp. TaxID=2065821 RepID=UPI0038600C7E